MHALLISISRPRLASRAPIPWATSSISRQHRSSVAGCRRGHLYRSMLVCFVPYASSWPRKYENYLVRSTDRTQTNGPRPAPTQQLSPCSRTPPLLPRLTQTRSPVVLTPRVGARGALLVGRRRADAVGPQVCARRVVARALPRDRRWQLGVLVAAQRQQRERAALRHRPRHLEVALELLGRRRIGLLVLGVDGGEAAPQRGPGSCCVGRCDAGRPDP